jgi:hypothetical protein
VAISYRQLNSILNLVLCVVQRCIPILFTLLFLTATITVLYYKCQLQSQSHIATDDQSISKYWCRAPSAAHDQIFITFWELRSCFSGAPSLTRRRVCLLYMLLALASVVFLGFESLGTRDHILLSQIWDFPFRRLLRLAGWRWGNSNPPPHGWLSASFESRLLYSGGTDHAAQRTQLLYCCRGVLPRTYLANSLGANHIEKPSSVVRIIALPSNKF